MPSIGDLANHIGHALYEARLVVAAVSVGALIVVVVVARRLGWFAAARRHPRRTAAAVMVAAALIAPVGWYLGSPIFIRTALVEAGPVGAATLRSPVATETAGPLRSPPATPSRPSATPSPMPTPRAFPARTVATGAFIGTDEFHFGRGTARIIEVEPGRFHLRLEDFSVRNGPDLYVYLSPEPDGYDPIAVELGRLKATDGAFGYDLPSGTDPATFRSALIWCKQFSHLFAYATLESAG